jgi:hypothetical protein
MTQKTTTGRLVAAIGGLILIVSLFLKWAGADIPDSLSGAAAQAAAHLPAAARQAVQNAQDAAKDAASANAFDLFGLAPFLYILIGLFAILPCAFDLFNLDIELPFDVSLVALVGGVLALGGIFIVLDSPGSAKIGVWLALLGSIAITVGGALQLRENGAAPQPAYTPPPQPPPAV